MYIDVPNLKTWRSFIIQGWVINPMTLNIKKNCHYAEMLINILNHPIKIKHLASWRQFIIRGWVILFRGRGTPADPRGGGPWWVTFSKKGWGPWWVTQRGWGDRDQSFKRGGGTREAPPIIIKGRGEGQIMLMWPFKTQYLLGRFWYRKDVCEVPAILLVIVHRMGCWNETVWITAAIRISGWMKIMFLSKMCRPV